MSFQQSLTGCAFCAAPPTEELGIARTWGKDERVSHPICAACAIQTTPDPDERDHHACDGCGVVVDCLAALTSFRVELGHLKGTIRLCADCAPGGAATYWTRDLDDHVIE